MKVNRSSEQEIAWLREQQLRIHALPESAITHPGEREQGLFDMLTEEILVMEQVAKAYTQLYQEARERATDRNTGTRSNDSREEMTSRSTFILEMKEGFIDGMEAVLQPDYNENTINCMAEKVLSETNYGFAFFLGVCSVIEAKKGQQYLAQWQKRGVAGILNHVQRKHDRIEAITSGDGSGEGLITTLADQVVYCGKWGVLQSEISRNELLSWVKEAQSLYKEG